MQGFGAFPGAIVTVAPCCRTINDRGEMVGLAIDGTTFNSRAIIWQHKVPVDLNTLIPENSPWYLQGAASINDAGEIVGFGLINSEAHAFLATPGGSWRINTRRCSRNMVKRHAALVEKNLQIQPNPDRKRRGIPPLDPTN
jgi:hypothetical protein